MAQEIQQTLAKDIDVLYALKSNFFVRMVTHALPLSRLAPNFKELEPPAVGRLSEIHSPTLVVLGEKDTSDIHAIGKLLHEQVAASELVMIPDVGHTLVMEKPSEFNTLVDHFLQ